MSSTPPIGPADHPSRAPFPSAGGSASTPATSRSERKVHSDGSVIDGLRLLSVKDLAAIFHVGEAAIRKRIRLRQLGPVIRHGKGYYMRAESLRRFLEGEEERWESESA